MKCLTYAQNLHELNLIKDEGMHEVILGHRDYSRFGKLNDQEYFSLVKRANELGLRVLFEWDILMTEDVFSSLTQNLEKFLTGIQVIRTQDPGALQWCLENTDRPLHFIAENGNHNLAALKGWVEYGKGRIESIALSLELTKAVIEVYVKEIGIPCELMGFGRIPLFYTPRGLLSALDRERLSLNEELAAIGESEESPHKGFPIVENRHGTFMFHIKEFCLIDQIRDLQEAGLARLRLDLRWSGLQWLKEIVGLVDSFSTERFRSFKESYPQELMRGFYMANKTDILFPKLKNHRLQKREGNYLGEVLEAEKGSHLALLIKHSQGLKKTDHLRIVHPRGEEFDIPIHWMKDLNFQEVDYAPQDTLVLIPFVNGVWVKSQVFLKDLHE